MKSTTTQVDPAAPTLWRCGGRQCAPGTCDHDADLLRHAAGRGPSAAPPIVHDVLRSGGGPLPAAVRHAMRERLGHDFAGVRIHTDDRAGQSALAVEARAYTVGQHVVFGPGEFDPSTTTGRQLLVHELHHTLTSPPITSAPAGLRVSSPDEPAERDAARVSAGVEPGRPAPAQAPAVLRQQSAVRMTGARVNHDRVTVPPEQGLTFTATPRPASATGVTWRLSGTGGTVMDPGTTISGGGAITVATSQAGGSAQAQATQTITNPDGSSQTTSFTVPFNFTAIPGSISGTRASTRGARGSYGGDFTHTFSPPTGSRAAALHRAHVNERFAGTTGATLALNGNIGSITITVNDPSSTTAGWDLTSSGEMAGPDHVTWTHAGFDARPFVVNASNPNPANRLPQGLTAAQGFHNLSFPSRTYGGTAVASTTHRRAFEERSSLVKAVTSALPPGSTSPEVEEDYEGPAIFRRCTADPATVAPSSAAPPGGRAPAPHTSTVSVDREGADTTARFSIQGTALGCTVDPRTGVVRIGTTPGTIRVRAGVAANFDETTITIAAPTPPTPTPTPPTPTPAPGAPGP